MTVYTQEYMAGKVCLQCHHTSDMDVGPSFQAISARYKTDASAVEKLVKVVKEGGVGNWGQIPMPSIRTVDESEARELVTWILNDTPNAVHTNPQPQQGNMGWGLGLSAVVLVVIGFWSRSRRKKS